MAEVCGRDAQEVDGRDAQVEEEQMSEETEAQERLDAITKAVVNQKTVLDTLREEQKGLDSRHASLKSSLEKGEETIASASALQKRVAELETANKALEADVDLDEVKKLATEMGKAEAEQAAATLDAKSKALDETKESLTTLADKHESLLYETKATPLLLGEKIGVRPDALADALGKVHKHFELKDGDFVLRDATAHKFLRDKEGDPVTLDGFGPFLREQYPFYFNALSGAGSQASDGRPSSNGTMNVEEAGNLSPAEFKKARAAGQLPRRFS